MGRILVVDDSPTAVRAVELALNGEGHDIESLDSFIHLTSAVRSNPPDLILLDLRIPALSGVSMGQLIRRHQCRPIPILIYSSQPEAELRTAAHRLDAVGYLPKGTPPAELAAEVRRALAGALPPVAVAEGQVGAGRGR